MWRGRGRIRTAPRSAAVASGVARRERRAARPRQSSEFADCRRFSAKNYNDDLQNLSPMYTEFLAIAVVIQLEFRNFFQEDCMKNDLDPT